MEQDPGGSSGGFESYTSKAGMKEVDPKERKGGDFTNYKGRAGCCCEYVDEMNGNKLRKDESVAHFRASATPVRFLGLGVAAR
jgi:hypothetical protein